MDSLPRVRARSSLLLVTVLVLALVAGCGGTKHEPRSVEPAQPHFSPSATASYLPAVTRPNVLVVEADDMRTDDLQFMPNVEKLIAGRGVTFENSFAPYPLCCPSRASFLSGKYAHNHGVLSHEPPWGFHAFDDRTTIATVLQKAGYKTALVGKYLNGYAQQPTHTGADSRTYVPPGWTDWYGGSDHLYGNQSPLFGGTYNYFHYTQVINGKVVPHPDQYSTDVNAAETRGRIRAYAKDKKPWFIWWTPTAPHFGRPHEKDDPKPTRTDHGFLEHFETPARPAWVRGHFDKQITHALGQPPFGPAEADMSDKPDLLNHVPEMNAKEKKALTEVTRQRAEALFVLDRQLGVTLKTLQNTGQWDNTVVMFTSDNGYYLGEHRKRQGKILAHEPSLRVPLVVAGPGIAHGRRYDPVTTIDMAPTLAQYAGTTMPDTDGTSFLPDLEHGDTGWTTPVVTEGRDEARRYARDADEHLRPGFTDGLDTRGIRTARWKYTQYSTGEEELYDLQNDPLELNGLQADPQYAGIKKKMITLWFRYIHCREQACDRPLPKEFQATPAQEKALTDDQVARTNAYYGDHWPE